jgi:hypothetical protein
MGDFKGTARGAWLARTRQNAREDESRQPSFAAGGLLLSEFLPSRHFAELTAVTMLGALVGDLFLLPACLVLMWRRPGPREACSRSPKGPEDAEERSSF